MKNNGEPSVFTLLNGNGFLSPGQLSTFLTPVAALLVAGTKLV